MLRSAGILTVLVLSSLAATTTGANPGGAPAQGSTVGKGGAVNVVVEAVLGADGSLKGTLTSTWSAACASDLSGRLAKLKPAEHAAALNALAGPLLAGHVKPDPDVKGLGQAGADLIVTYVIDAPRFAPSGGGTKGALSLGLPLLLPYDQLKTPATVLPLRVNHDITIKLPPRTVPLELPSAFSTVTPDAGRYVLYFDLARTDTVVLKARRELEISGTVTARLSELAEGVVPRDAVTLIIVASKPPAAPGSS